MTTRREFENRMRWRASGFSPCLDDRFRGWPARSETGQPLRDWTQRGRGLGLSHARSNGVPASQGGLARGEWRASSQSRSRRAPPSGQPGEAPTAWTTEFEKPPAPSLGARVGRKGESLTRSFRQPWQKVATAAMRPDLSTRRRNLGPTVVAGTTRRGNRIAQFTEDAHRAQVRVFRRGRDHGDTEAHDQGRQAVPQAHGAGHGQDGGTGGGRSDSGGAGGRRQDAGAAQLPYVPSLRRGVGHHAATRPEFCSMAFRSSKETSGNASTISGHAVRGILLR